MMNATHRKVLEQNLKDLVQQVILTEDFKAELRQSELFPEGMLDMIVSEKTERKKVYKMLELLPTRGPSAFNTFLSILEKDYPWLREKLQAELDREMSEQSTGHIHNHGSRAPQTQAQNMTGSDEHHDVRSRVSSFLHKRFGQSRKISEKDKRAIEKWVTDCVQEERTAWKTRLESQARLNAKSTEKGMEDISARIEILNLKLESCLSDASGDKGDNSSTTNPKTYSHMMPDDALVCLDHNINIMQERLQKLTSDQNKCFTVISQQQIVHTDRSFTAKRKSMTSLYREVIRMKQLYDEKVQQFQRENKDLAQQSKEQVEELLVENQELIEIKDKQKKEIEYYLKEMYSLRMKNDQLEDKLRRQEKYICEQDKTIENLKGLISGASKQKEKQSSNQSNWQVLKGQRQTLASQRTKRRVLSKVNSIYLSEGSRAANKATKKE